MAKYFDCNTISLKKGARGDNVELLQKYLIEFGYTLAKDGIFGNQTDGVLKKFQRDTNNADDGWFAKQTCSSLKVLVDNKDSSIKLQFDCPNTNIATDSTNSAGVMKLQQMLYNLGYYTGKIDGKFKKYTRESLEDFETDNGLDKTGVLKGETCKKLNEAVDKNLTKKIMSQAATAKKTTKKTTKKAVVVKDVNAVDTTKNFIDPKDANISIDGLYFIATSTDPTQAFRNSSWKQIELADNKLFPYKGHHASRAYTVETYIHKLDLKNIMFELEKMQNRVCHVINDEIPTGDYLVSVTYAKSKGLFRKVTFTLLEST